MANIVQFENVGLRYGHGDEVLRDLSFTLAAGEFYFLTGASGAGKTSLLKLLYLAQRPSRGVIRLFGTDVVTLPRARMPGFRRRIGVVYQDFRLVPHLSIADNVALPLRIAGVLLTMFNRNIRAHQQVCKQVYQALGESVFQTIIPECSYILEASAIGMDVIKRRLNSVGATGYIRLANEVLDRFELR